jgi:3-oxoadipate enol-lactonase
MDALPLEFDDIGTGRPVVLLHPFPLNRFFWRPMVAALGGRIRTIAPDYRGFGDSPARAPFSMDSYADDIVAVLDRLKVEKATFFGVSMGGYVAFSIWRRHRARVQALILAHTRAEADNDTQAAARRTNVKLVLQGGAQVLVPRMFQNMVGITTHADRPLIATQVRLGMENAPRQGTLGALEALLKRVDSVPTLRTITVPTLIVSGEEDTLTPPALQATIHAGIPGSRLVSIPNVGHLGPIELPERFAREVEGFVQGLPG